jgi:hypothetical protein
MATALNTETKHVSTQVTQDVKEAMCNVIIMSSMLYELAQQLPQELHFGLPEQLLAHQRKLIPLLPAQTQQWVMKEVQKDKMDLLPLTLKNHIKVGEGVHGLLYEQLTKLLDYLAENKKRVKFLDYEKYRLLLKFITDEAEADLTNGTSALTHADGSIVFKLVKPTSGK